MCCNWLETQSSSRRATPRDKQDVSSYHISLESPVFGQTLILISAGLAKKHTSSMALRSEHPLTHTHTYTQRGQQGVKFLRQLRESL